MEEHIYSKSGTKVSPKGEFTKTTTIPGRAEAMESLKKWHASNLPAAGLDASSFTSGAGIGQTLQPAAILQATGPVRYFAPNCPIYIAGDLAEALLKVVSGVVRTVRFLHDGKRQIDAFYASGDLFGFERGAFYTLSAEAVSGCTLVSYDCRGLAVLAMHNQELTRQLYGYTLDGLVHAREHVRLLSHAGAIEKLAGFLIECSESSVDRSLITLPMARQDIADYLGITVETVSRTLTELRKASFIDLISPRKIRLKNLPGLRFLNSDLG